MARSIGRECAFAAAAGVLAALALPGFGASGLVYVALVPLLYALNRARTVRRGVLFGLLFGVAFFAIDVRWSLAVARFNPLVIPGYVLLAAYLAIPFALAAGVLVWLSARRSAWTWLLAAPALFVLAEFARTLGPFGTGFSMLHHALYRAPWLIQSASVFGSWMITAFIVATNVALYQAFRERRVRFAFLAIALVAAQAAFALLPTSPVENTGELDVALLSSNVDQAVKLDGRNLPELTERYSALAEEALAQSPDLIVFPESFLPAYVLDRSELLEWLANLAWRGNTELLFGTGEYVDRAIYNAVVLLDRDGEIAGRYWMVRPVPFGEYIPGRTLLEELGLGAWTRSLLPLDLSRGTESLPIGGYGTPICFESVFAAGARSFVRNGADLLVTVTNDAWFDGSSELHAHFAAAVFRAIETRRWTIQVANGGVSGVVDERGRIRSSFLGEGVVVQRDVKRLVGMSFYVRWGDEPLLIGLSLLLGLSVALYALPRRSKKRGE